MTKFLKPHLASDKAQQQAWSKGGRFSAVGFNDGRVRIYMIHPPSGNSIDRIAELSDHNQPISSLEWAQDKNDKVSPRLLSTSFDGTARIWSFSSQKWECKVIDCVADETTDPKKRPKVCIRFLSLMTFFTI